MGRTDLRRRVARALDRLESSFGLPRQRRMAPPLDELILTILSQNTNDRNRDRAYASLRRRFPTWEGVLRARPGQIEAAIRTGGLSRTKSRVIGETLRRVKRERGRLSLEFLRRLPTEQARIYLARFKGVGEKTVNCVLLFSCGRSTFPVDTHIHRVARRLGWVPPGATPARTHEIMGRLVPAARCLSGHINLITLGRRYCRPRTPDCQPCPVRMGCQYGRSGRARRGRETGN